MLQCGSPTNNGQGGPGYTVPDENLPEAGTDNYPEGTVAMANAGAGTVGQPVLHRVQGHDPAARTTRSGARWCPVSTSSRSVAAAGVQGGGADGKPAQPIVITKATTRETTQAG